MRNAVEIVRDHDGIRARRLIFAGSGRVLYDAARPLPPETAVKTIWTPRRDADGSWWILLLEGDARKAIARIFPTANLGQWSERHLGFWAVPR